MSELCTAKRVQNDGPPSSSFSSVDVQFDKFDSLSISFQVDCTLTACTLLSMRLVHVLSLLIKCVYAVSQLLSPFTLTGVVRAFFLLSPMANVLTVQGLQNISPRPRDDFLALRKIKNPPLDVWRSLSKFTQEERNRLLTAVVVS